MTQTTGTTRTIVREHEAELVVQKAEVVAEDVIALTLASPAGETLPAWSPGAHIDLMLADDVSGTVTVHKVPSTPADPSEATMTGLAELCAKAGVDPAALDQLFHGTTVATNALLERRGARTALVATEGFEHVLHLRRQDRAHLYRLCAAHPEPLVPLERCHGVRGRIGPDGELAPRDEGRARRLCQGAGGGPHPLQPGAEAAAAPLRHGGWAGQGGGERRSQGDDGGGPHVASCPSSRQPQAARAARIDSGLAL